MQNFRDLTESEKKTLARVTYERVNSFRATAAELGISYNTARKWITRSGAKIRPKSSGQDLTTVIGKHKRDAESRSTMKIVVEGEYQERPTKKVYDGKRRRYILTCAQNNTRVHEPTWTALRALAEHYGAELMVSRFTYRLDSYKQGEVKPGHEKNQYGVWYDPRIERYRADERVELAPGLVWCGELNILPTAVLPISGLESYTGRASSIFPHVKLQMESVPSGKYEPTKFCYTTGTVTTRNYIHKKAGMKADFHHVYGGLLVEVDEEGDWFVRQLNVDDHGCLYDLDIKFDPDQGIVPNQAVLALNWGDIHVAKMNEGQFRVCWQDKDSIARTLHPGYQFMHDTLDFRSRNHHERHNPHTRYLRHVEGTESVEGEIIDMVRFLNTVGPFAEETVIVNSNHDMALEKWLREADYRSDPVNALYFLILQTQVYRWIQQGVKNDRSIVSWACERAGLMPEAACRFLLEDESFLIADREIECGMHGHQGPDGRRGSRAQFARMGRKANIGHSHSAGIRDGVYQAGITGDLDMGYNVGPSSWSHSHIVTYANGKRAIITVWNNKWRA